MYRMDPEVVLELLFLHLTCHAPYHVYPVRMRTCDVIFKTRDRAMFAALHELAFISKRHLCIRSFVGCKRLLNTQLKIQRVPCQ